jgi:hypothetical protein
VHHPQQQQRSEQPAQHLCDPVAQQIDERDAPSQESAEGDRRVDMAAGYRTDHSDQAEQDQSEDEAGQQDAGRDAGAEAAESEADRRNARPEEHEQARADELGKVSSRHRAVDEPTPDARPATWLGPRPLLRGQSGRAVRHGATPVAVRVIARMYAHVPEL